MGAFANVNEYTSYLGFGLDPIRSSIVSDKAMHTSHPIFDLDGLMRQKLIISGGQSEQVNQSQGASMSSFMESWNAHVDVNVSFGFIGRGSVDVDAKYSGAFSNYENRYYYAQNIYYDAGSLSISIDDIKDFQDILTTGFKRDLYDANIAPQALFDKYGSHFLSSCTTGGRIVVYYEMGSESSSRFHEVTAAIDVDVKTLGSSTSVGLSGGYKQIAQRESIYIESSLEMIGGVTEETAILRDTDIPRIYNQWVAIVRQNPVLMGLKDISSLCPVWELIPDEENTSIKVVKDDGTEYTTTRRDQLRDYFNAYGENEYRKLLSKYDIEYDSVEEINNITVDGQDRSQLVYVNNTALPSYFVSAGGTPRINFSVVPATANYYTSYSLSEDKYDEYKTVNDDGSVVYRSFANVDGKGRITIDKDAPDGHTILVSITAGGINQRIVLQVVQYKNIQFITNSTMPTFTVSIIGGQTIKPPVLDPEQCGRENFTLEGWYTDPDLDYNNKFDFVNTSVNGNLKLYAKWVETVYTIRLNTLGGTMPNGKTFVTTNYSNNFMIEKPQDPIKEHARFEGWYYDAQYNDVVDFDTDKFKADCTIYAKWQGYEVFYVSYENLSGATYNGELSFDETMPDLQLTTVKHPNTDYIFLGWYADPQFVKPIDSIDTKSNGNVAVYAKWDIPQYFDYVPIAINALSDKSRAIIDISGGGYKARKLSIASSITSLKIIGSKENTYKDFSISLAQRDSNFSLTLDNFSFTSMRDVVAVDGTAMTPESTLSIEFIGTTMITGGDGSDGKENGTDGSTGKAAIDVAGNLIIKSTEDSIVFKGGNGGKGKDGQSYSRVNNPNGYAADGRDGQKGGNGGNGAPSIVARELTLLCNDVSFISGSGGRAGDGGDGEFAGFDKKPHAHAGKGGQGGRGGDASDAVKIQSVSRESIIKGKVALTVSDSGSGGNGGNGGHSDEHWFIFRLKWSLPGSGGSGGQRGASATITRLFDNYMPERIISTSSANGKNGVQGKKDYY